MSSKKNYQCLMIKTKDNRHFFTYQKNFPQLIEFSKTFGAEISVVKVKEAEVLQLDELAPAFCDANYQHEPDYDLIEVKIAEFKKIGPKPPKTNRTKALETAAQVRSYVLQEFISGEVVSLHRVLKKFKTLSISTVCNHIRTVKQQLAKEGYEIKKIGAGKYQCV